MQVDDENKLTEGFEELMKHTLKNTIITDGVISNVRETDMLVAVTISGQLFKNVPLKVLVKTQPSIIEVPADQSPCLICLRNADFTTPQILMIQNVKKYLWKIGSQTLQFDTNGFIFNGGSDFMVFASKILTKLNNLENAYNDLVVKYNAHVHSGVTTGPGSSAVTTSLETTVIIPTIADDIKNPKIKQ